MPTPPCQAGPEQQLLDDARRQWDRMANLPEEARRRRFVAWMQVRVGGLMRAGGAAASSWRAARRPGAALAACPAALLGARAAWWRRLWARKPPAGGAHLVVHIWWCTSGAHPACTARFPAAPTAHRHLSPLSAHPSGEATCGATSRVCCTPWRRRTPGELWTARIEAGLATPNSTRAWLKADEDI